MWHFTFALSRVMFINTITSVLFCSVPPERSPWSRSRSTPRKSLESQLRCLDERVRRRNSASPSRLARQLSQYACHMDRPSVPPRGNAALHVIARSRALEVGVPRFRSSEPGLLNTHAFSAWIWQGPINENFATFLICIPIVYPSR